MDEDLRSQFTVSFRSRIHSSDHIHSFNYPSKRRIPLAIGIIFAAEIVSGLIAYADEKFCMSRPGRDASEGNRSIGVRQFCLPCGFMCDTGDLS